MTEHFEGLKLICHTCSHSSRAERSSCNWLFSLSPFTVKCRRLSLVKSLVSEEFSESGRSLIYAKNSSGPDSPLWDPGENSAQEIFYSRMNHASDTIVVHLVQKP